MNILQIAGTHCAICGRPYLAADYANLVLVGMELAGYKTAHGRCWLGSHALIRHLGLCNEKELRGIISVRIFPATSADNGQLAKIEFRRAGGKTRYHKTAPDSASVGRLMRFMDKDRTRWTRDPLTPEGRDGRMVLVTTFRRAEPSEPLLSVVTGDDEDRGEFAYDSHDW